MATRLVHGARRLGQRVGFEAQTAARLHVAAFVGLLAALASELAHTDGTAKALIGFGVAVLVRQAGEISSRRARLTCELSVATHARAVLDARLSVDAIERVEAGNWLVLRDLAATPDATTLGRVIFPGGEAAALAKEVGGMRSWFLTELGTCYSKLRGSTQRLVDTFTTSLENVVAPAYAISYGDLSEPERPADLDELLKAVRACVIAGDALDTACDPDGAAAATKERRDIAAAADLRAARAVEALVANARAALASVVASSADEELLPRLEGAISATRNVGASVFQDASDEARAAHRKITEDLAKSIVLAQRLDDDGNATELSAVLEGIPADLDALERLAGRG